MGRLSRPVYLRRHLYASEFVFPAKDSCKIELRCIMRLMYINGEFTKGDARDEIEVTNPATEEVLDTVPRGTPGDVEAAVRSSLEAFKSWRKMGANERTSLLHEVAARVRHHKAELVQLLTLEEGKPATENDEELEWVANTFD